jgi:cytochrome bd-type quinol oxidase subunit 2
MIGAAFFVLVPLAAYVPMFAYELYIAFRRIGKPKDKGGAYLHATWESTHTFLILGVNYFMWLYSSAVVAVGQAVFVPLLLFGATFIVRAILYVYLFYIKTNPKPNITADWLFALSHLVMAVCLGAIVLTGTTILLAGTYAPNHLLLPLLLPGLIMMIPLIAVPLYFLYKTKSR